MARMIEHNWRVPVWALTALVLAVGPIALAAAQSRQAGLTAATHQEVAAARAATAKYHDIAQAEADGYIDFGLYEPGEGFHWVNLSLIDTQFEPAHPR